MRVIYIDIDTLRKDHMSCYGYGRKTTPNLDEIARKGVCFSNYFCSDAPCLPSRSALISGKFGIRNGAVGHGGTAADRFLTGEERQFRDQSDTSNFTNIFRRSGMKTISISTFAERHSSFWFNAGFNEIYNVGLGGMESGEVVMPVALDWAKRCACEDNWYLHLQLWDPHTPYRAPLEFGRPFENDPLPDDWINREIFGEHLEHTGPHSANEINMFDDNTSSDYPRHPGRLKTLSDVKKFIDDYDTGILYADYLIGQLFDIFKQQGIYDDLAVIISSDHGENMGELGIYGEHATADKPTCNIPLIIKWPGCQKGLMDNEFHYNIDLAPTVAELLNIPGYHDWDGTSFAKTITDGRAEGYEYLVLSQMAHVCQRSVLFDKYLYIKTYHCGYHLFPDEMLFDLENDPHEINNLAEKYPYLCRQANIYYEEWHSKNMKKSKTGIDPMDTVIKEGGPFHAKGQLESYLKRLEETGRNDGANQLREKYLNL